MGSHEAAGSYNGGGDEDGDETKIMSEKHVPKCVQGGRWEVLMRVTVGVEESGVWKRRRTSVALGCFLTFGFKCLSPCP